MHIASGITGAFIVVVTALVLIDPIWVSAAKLGYGCIGLSEEARTECYEDVLPELFPRYSVGEIFRFIQDARRIEPALADCHFVAHSLGKRVVADDPTQWPLYIREEVPESICSGGYIHGLTIAAYDHEGLTDDEIETQLPRLREACADMRLNDHLNCVHGIGHMLYYITGGDVRRSLPLCDRVMDHSDMEQSFNDARRCHTGVMMMLVFSFVDPEWEPSVLYTLTRENIRDFCDSFGSSAHQGACLRSSWALFPESIESAAGIEAFCTDQPDAHEEQWCHLKLFIAAAWKYIGDLDRIRALCDEASTRWQYTCLVSVTREILAQDGVRAAGRVAELCASLSERLSERCFEIVVADAGRYFGADRSDAAPQRFCSALPKHWRERCLKSPLR